MAREKASKQSSVVKLCQYFGAHFDGHRYEAGICPILANPLTIAMAAARLTGGRGILVLTHPRRRMPPRKVISVISDVKGIVPTTVAHAHSKQRCIPSSSGLGYGGEVGELECKQGMSTDQ